MNEPRRRLIERIVHPSYLHDLTARPLDELREMREECRAGEAEISFERRVCQARIDILNAEMARRAGGGTSEDLMAQLPEILSGGPESQTGPLPARAPNFSIPRSVDAPRRRLVDIPGEKALAHLSELSEAEAEALKLALVDYERELSRRRKLLHEVMDGVQSEIVRRYVSGEADPSRALG